MLLEINHTSGMPGSFFTITGFNYLPDDMVAIQINGVVLGSVASDSSGGFVS